MLCDIVIPKNTYSYVLLSSNASNSYEDMPISNVISNDDKAGTKIYTAKPDKDYTFRVKFTVDKSTEKYGIAVKNLYAPNAAAYMRECTEEQYNAAENYKEAVAAEDNVAEVSA